MTAAEIARALGGACHSGAWWRCRCPVHVSGGATLALRDGERALVTYCHGGCDRRDVLAELRRRGLLDSRTRQASLPPPAMRSNHRRDERDADGRRRALIARDIWHRARDPRGTLVERYLASRGLALPNSPVLRYAPLLRHPTGIYLAAMIGRIDDVDGRMIAIHRTWLRPDGGKADIDPPRATLAPTRGGAVRLGVIRPGDWLVIGEGIETNSSATNDMSQLSQMSQVVMAAWGKDEGAAIVGHDSGDPLREVEGTPLEPTVLAPGLWFDRFGPPGEPPFAKPCVPRRGRVDRQGRLFLHFCVTCGAWGAFGYGVTGDRPGRWYCHEHRPKDEAS